MNAKTEVQSTSMDTLKLLLAVILLVGGIVGFYVLEAQPLWIRLLALLGAVAVAAFVFVQSAQGKQIKHFAGSSYTEVRKVVWPSRQETVQTTLVIIIAVLVMSLFLWGVDSLLFLLVRSVTG